MRGNFEEAEKELKDVLLKDSCNYKARYTLGKVYEDQDRLEEAMIEYQRACILVLEKSIDSGFRNGRK